MESAFEWKIFNLKLSHIQVKEAIKIPIDWHDGKFMGKLKCHRETQMTKDFPFLSPQKFPASLDTLQHPIKIPNANEFIE